MDKLVIVLVVQLLTGLSCAEQNHILITPENVQENQLENDTCPGQCYSLQYVLSHHELFFVSNTTIELMPGQYVVNESFGNILIESIEHFTMTRINSNRSNTSSAITIYCDQYGTLGLYFLNVTNVTVSSIHLSYCNGDTPNGRVAQLFQVNHDNVLDNFEMNKCTLAFFSSSNIVVSNMTLDYSDVIGLLTLGVYNNFQLSECTISHNKVNIIVVTKNHSDSMHEYKITNSWIAYGNASNGDIASGINILFAHKSVGNIRLLLQNITLVDNRAQEGNLLIAIVNCDFKPLTENETWKTGILIALYDIVSKAEGQEHSEKGLVITTWSDLCNTEYRKDQLVLIADNCKFVQGCIEVKANFDYFLMSRTIVEGTPCLCDYAVSFTPAPLDRSSCHTITIDTFLLTESCASEFLMKIECFTLTFKGITRFLNNSGSIVFENCDVTFKGSTLISNSTSHESPLSIKDSEIHLKEGSSLLVQNNVGEQCGGIKLIRSRMELGNKANLMFSGNYGYDGGALALYGGSEIDSGLYGGSEIDHGLFDDINIVFESNTAQHYGGGIYVDDASYQSGKVNLGLEFKCFNQNLLSIYFRNNSAKISGNALFGGWVDFCIEMVRLATLIPSQSKELSESINVTNNKEKLYEISSSPSRVCICIDFTPQCNITNYNYQQPLFAGQTFNIQAVAVGQRFGTVPSTVTARFINDSTNISELQHVQNVGQRCTSLNYTVQSPKFNVKQILLLTVENNFIPEPDFTALQNIPYFKHQLLVFHHLTVTITLLKCPLGFFLDNLSNTCTCQKILNKHGILCNIQNQTVVRKDQMWINATFIHTDSEVGNPGIIVHQHCPFDYCKNVNQQYLDLQYPDDQCAFQRSGILCGGCPQIYSHVFGTSNCKKCSNLWTILVLFLFVVTGIGLVALLISLNLTVSIGTINGLIFYAHIMRANQASFFPPQMTNTFLSWFIAWLNLDLGIEMCFFDGLDAYTKTWLQFLFPLYIWTLVIVIITSSHYYTFAARLSGSNAVQVLATLFLMSYAKMLRITITVFSSTTLVYPDGHPRRVWLYDGNVDYLKGKTHTSLHSCIDTPYFSLHSLHHCSFFYSMA